MFIKVIAYNNLILGPDGPLPLFCSGKMNLTLLTIKLFCIQL